MTSTKKSLIKSANKIYSFNTASNELEDITPIIENVEDISLLEYTTHGIDDMSVIPSSEMERLTKPIGLLHYMDNIDNTTANPKVRQEYDLNIGCRIMLKKPII